MKIFPKGKLIWVVLAIAAYAYYNEYVNNRQVTPPQTSALLPGENNESATNTVTKKTTTDESLSNKIVDKLKQNDTAKVVIEALVKKAAEDKYGKNELIILAARKTGNLSIIDIIRGPGATLHCGATATINYSAFMSSGLEFDSTKSKDKTTPITIRTGSGQVIAGLEAGIVGMREGGRRKISIPAELAFNQSGFDNSMLRKDEVILYDVELVAVKDGPYKHDLTIITNNATAGTGSKLLCGALAKIKYKIDNQDQNSGEIEITHGAGNIPIGFELALADMHAGGKKSVTIPPVLLKIPSNSKLPTTTKFNPTTPTILELELPH